MGTIEQAQLVESHPKQCSPSPSFQEPLSCVLDACMLARGAHKAPLIFCIKVTHRLQKPEQDSPDNPILNVKGGKAQGQDVSGMTGTDSTSPIPKERPGAWEPCSQGPSEGKRTPDLPVRPEAKLTCEIRDQFRVCS